MLEEPTGPYIYQPFGVQHAENWACERIYAIAGMRSASIKITGLKKKEAELLLDFIIKKQIGFQCSAEVDYYQKIMKGEEDE